MQIIILTIKDLLITAGAGIGVDSGMPDFRGPTGFWNTFGSFKNKFSFQDCASPAFMENYPLEFWGFYGYRLAMYRETIPHQGFNILINLANTQFQNRYMVVTSNVDGQFQKAGVPEEKMYEIHGSIHRFQCNNCNILIPATLYKLNVDTKTFQALSGQLPKCGKCNSLLRPNILMFNDSDFNSKSCDAQAILFDQFIKGIKRDESLCIIEIGAGTAVSSIRDIGNNLLTSQNSFKVSLIRINLRESEFQIFNQKSKLELDNFVGIAQSSLKALQDINKLMKIQHN